MRRPLWIAMTVLAASCAGAVTSSSGGPGPAVGPAAGPGMDAVLAHVLASPDLDGAVVGEPAPGATGVIDGPPGTQPATRATLLIVFASWCPHCHDEIAVLDAVRAAHPGVRVIGINYRGHEEYDARGNADAVRRYVRTYAPWLRTVAIDDELFGELGRPPKIPSLYVYDARGALVVVYDRRERAMPDAGELEQLFARLGA